MKRHTVNKLGLEMIRQELLSRCKPSVLDGWLHGDLISSNETQNMLASWAGDLEEALDADNGDFVEIRGGWTKSGHVENLTISATGIDVNFETEVPA